MNDKNHAEAVVSTLRSFRLLEWDWDGAGGLPLRSDVADTAVKVFEEDSIVNLINCPLPTVSLNGNGTVEVAYADEFTERELWLTFQCEGVITYIKRFEDDQTTIEGTARIGFAGIRADEAADLNELRELFCWLSEEA